MLLALRRPAPVRESSGFRALLYAPLPPFGSQL